MNIRTVTSKRILTRQKRGFLTEGAYPFTHTLSWAVGCGFGKTYCGQYCYAQMIPNWYYNRQEGENWGDAVVIKENAPQLLDAELSKSRDRSQMRIFMSSVTDPYQPLERKHRMTRRCLEVFRNYDDLDLLVIQTRGAIVTDDAELIASIPYAYVSMTIETDRGDLAYGPNDEVIRQRLGAIKTLNGAGVKTQITVSPCLPYTSEFVDTLIDSGAGRIVVDTFVDGDGTKGQRTAETAFADRVDYDWRDGDPARDLYETLKARGAVVGWSVDGFGGIAPREEREL